MIKNPLKFPPGSEWLFVKMYGGSQALEEWIIGPFRLLWFEWKQKLLVKQFHFNHYLDPDYHLRIRFLLSDPVHSGILLSRIYLTCTRLLEEDLIWKIETGTYEPEYDRYGIARFSAVESWFEIDSKYWLDEIYRLSVQDDPGIWKSALRSVDVLLCDFGADIDEKIIIINRLRAASAALCGIDKRMKSQLNGMYRKLSVEFNPHINIASSAPDRFLAERSSSSAKMFLEMKESFADRAELFGSDLLPDLIHMSLNRAFRTRHRIQELLVYDFLSRFYRSVKARNDNANDK